MKRKLSLFSRKLNEVHCFLPKLSVDEPIYPSIHADRSYYSNGHQHGSTHTRSNQILKQVENNFVFGSSAANPEQNHFLNHPRVKNNKPKFYPGSEWSVRDVRGMYATAASVSSGTHANTGRGEARAKLRGMHHFTIKYSKTTEYTTWP